MSLPILLPPTALPTHLRVSRTSQQQQQDQQQQTQNESQNPLAHLEWRPKKYLTDPQPPSNEDARLQEEFIQKQALEGKIVKKTRPRRTVDYNGVKSRKLAPNPGYVPQMRPAPPYIIDLLPPKAYPSNASTSLCTKFVHTSTNKIRCPVNVVTWTPEARRILTGSTSGEFTLWNGLTFNFETILQAHDTAITAMRFTHSGNYLASTDKSGVIKYFEPNMNNLTAWQGTNSGNREAIRGLSFSPDDQRFVTASDDSSLRIWSFKESRGENVLSGHGWDVKCVEWHPTKGLIVSGSKDSSVKFWDPRTGTCLSTLHQHKNTIQALAWSPNGNLLATGSRDQTVRVFDIRALKEFRVLKGHKKEVCAITWHPVHPVLVSGGSEGSILHWDLSSADMVDSTPAPAPPNTIAKDRTSSSSVPLFTGTTPVSQPRAVLSQAHDSNVWSLTYHPLGHILVSGSNDHTTRFWSRERPGDKTSVFAAGGEKPPEDMGGGEGEGDEDDGMGGMSVPGFGGLPGFGPPPGEQPQASGSAAGRSGGRDISGGWWREPEPPAQTQGGGYANDTNMVDDFAVPGFGGAPPGLGGSSSAGGGGGGGGSGYGGNTGGGYGSSAGGYGDHDSRRDTYDRDRGDRDRGGGGRDAFGRDIRPGEGGGYGDDSWGGGGGGGRGGRDDWGGDRRNYGYGGRNDRYGGGRRGGGRY
ncbi:polyadenylation factor subunit 2 [Coprinopsis cinerea okayama7|uniref:Polyadenylation factor subunit 2 n=1 Tax=Coprinopsis cinerea (strain Okayama-7 / 130 / ATCC MYA-4618 / FGSC 9003) TaxID=240176 RepID=D6RKS9_COPC7|nr:polyadenylation factor subunit 2 [Coprinopsis cinerea okayama7\|eukprot:XP_002911966.1 polyadenylation factor subunit 2 [Coprinopsis cinerea okayama7\